MVVRFICSKTDDILVGEAAESLGLEDEIARKYQELGATIEKRKAFRNSIHAVLKHQDTQLSIWEALRAKLERGEGV